VLASPTPCAFAAAIDTE